MIESLFSVRPQSNQRFMSLVLTIINVDELENGGPVRLELDRRGAVIGRSPHADWSLPDPVRYISSTHCEIDFSSGAYLLIDKSVNGVFLNGDVERLTAPYVLLDGDVLTIGQYEIRADVAGQVSRTAPSAPQMAHDIGDDMWGRHGGQAPANPNPGAWNKPAPRPEIHGGGAGSASFTPPAPRVVRTESSASVWDVTPSQPVMPPSEYSSPIADGASPATADDIWGRFSEVNQVDWGRSGFAGGGADPTRGAPNAHAFQPTDSPAEDIFGLTSAAAPSVPRPSAPMSTRPDVSRPETSRPERSHTAEAVASSVSTPPPDLTIFLTSAGLAPEAVKTGSEDALAAAGALLRRMVAGMVVMLEARARAKSQLGAQGTMLELNGNNPLKFARTPEGALAQLLNPPERGFMSADMAVEDGFKDLQAHQMATLAAMQGALAATLARFSPQAIRDRAETGGLLGAIVPNARAAALWKAYEKEFEGVARGSDEAFMDVFAKEFRKAYERASDDMRRRG